MSAGSQDSSSQYIHGSSAKEQEPLSRLNKLLNDACLQELELTGVKRVLDVGSGLGQFSRAMAASLKDSSETGVLGIERDSKQIATATQLADEAGEAKLVAFRQGDALDLPLTADEVGSFDLAHARFVLEHIPQQSQVVSEMARAVRPGGRVVLADDDHDTMRLWPEPAGFDVLWQAYVQSYSHAGSDPYIGRKLTTLLYDAGLRSLRNKMIFFGNCAGNETFQVIVDNLIAAFTGARAEVISQGIINDESFKQAIHELEQWKNHPSAALWFTIFWAEETVPVEINCVRQR